MCGSQKSTQKSTSTYTPNSQAMGAYQNLLTTAGGTANTAYNPATQQNVAGFQPLQQQAFTNIQGMQGGFQPMLDQAGQYITGAGGPIGANEIQQYMDPYTGQVIDATMAQLDRSNAIERSGLKGNAIAAGALGNDRAGVAQAELARVQGMNRASTVSGLNSQAYAQALAAAQQDKNRNLQVGQASGNLAALGQQLGYTDAGMLLNSGNQQQQQQQNVNDAASANASAETMWPYQNSQWLAGIVSALGPLMGGTTTGKATTSQGKGIGSIIGPALTLASGLSDRRAKEDATKIGKTFDGQDIWKYRYKGSPKWQIGLMADEVRESHPDAVSRGFDGLDRVNYDVATADSEFASGGVVMRPAITDPFSSRPGSGSNDSGGLPWAPIKASQPVIPQLESGRPSGGSGEGGSSSGGMDYAKMGGQISSILKGLDPAKGWGASIEPLSGASEGGKGIGALSSLFGFADGGRIDDEWMFENFPAGSGDGYTNVPKTRRGGGFTDIRKGSKDGDDLKARAFRSGDSPLLDLTDDLYADGGGVFDFSPGARFGFEGMPDFADIDPEWMKPSDRFGFSPMPSDFGSNVGEVGPSGMVGKSTPAGAEFIGEVGPPPADAYFDRPKEIQTNATIEGDPRPSASGRSVMDRASPELLRGVIMAESGGDPSLVNPSSGATGLMQVMPDTARDPGYGLAPLPQELLRDAGANKQFGTSYLNAMLKEFGGDVEAALIGYNAGPGNAAKWLAAGRNYDALPRREETEPYVRKVMGTLGGGDGSNAAVASAAPPAALGEARPGGALTDSYVGEVGASGFAPLPQSAGPPRGEAPKRRKGGLIERLTGVEFNPLQLDENERLAMMTAGLGMWGSGNVGDGVKGMQYLQAARGAEDENTARDRAYELERYKVMNPSTGDMANYNLAKSEGFGGNFTDFIRQTSRSGGDGTTSAMKEYELARSQGFQGSFLDYINESKRTPSSLGGEMGARIGLGDKFIRDDFEPVDERLKQWSQGDRLDLAFGRGEAGKVWRKIESGRDALVRQLTGAGMAVAEAENQAARYQIAPTDTVATMRSKISGLRADLEAVRGGAIEGKTGSMARKYKREQENAPADTAAGKTDKNAAPKLPQRGGESEGFHRIKTDEDYNKLPSGAVFIHSDDPEQKRRRKP